MALGAVVGSIPHTYKSYVGLCPSVGGLFLLTVAGTEWVAKQKQYFLNVDNEMGS